MDHGGRGVGRITELVNKWGSIRLVFLVDSLERNDKSMAASIVLDLAAGQG